MIRVLASIGAIQILIMLVALVRAKVLSTWLGPAAFGVMSTIDQVVMTVVQVSTFSLPFMAMKVMARSHSVGEEAFRHTFKAFLKVLSSLAIGTVIVLSAVLAWRPNTFGSELAPYRAFLVPAVLTVPAIILNILFVNTLAAAQAPAASAVLSLAVGFVLAAAAMAGALAAGIRGLYVAVFAAGVTTTGGTLWYLNRRFSLLATASDSVAQAIRANPDIATQSVLLWIALSAYSVTLFATRYAVLSILGETSAGLLQAQLSLSLTLGAVVAPMSGLYLAPLVNRKIAARDKASVADEFASKVAVLLLLGGLPLVLFPKLVVTVLYLRAFAPSADVLYVFVVWQCLYQIANVYLQLLIGLNEVLFFTIITCVAYVCAGVLFPMLIPLVGIAGAGWALVAAMVVAVVSAAVLLRARFGHTVGGIVWRRVGGTLAVFVIGGVVFATSTEWTPLGIAERAVYALVVVGLIWLGLAPDERRLFRRLVPKTPGL